MSRFATLPAAVAARSAFGIGQAPTPTATHEAGAGFAPSDPHMALFNAAIALMTARLRMPTRVTMLHTTRGASQRSTQETP